MEVKKTINKLLLFIAPLAVFFVLTEYRLAGFHDTYLRKREYFDKCKDSIHALFLGTSQVEFGINPSFISTKSYNMAEVNQAIYYDKQLFLKYLPDMPQLKLVVIDIDYFSLYYELSSSPEKWRSVFYKRFWGIPSKDVSIWDSRLYSYWELYTPYTVMAHIHDIFFQKIVPDFDITPAGYIICDTNADVRLKGDSNSLDILKRHDNLIKMNDFKAVCKYIEEIITTAQERNIHVVFISMPTMPVYYEGRNRALVNKTDSAINSFCNTYHLLYFNYTKDTRFCPDDFLDAIHMNFRGAKKFSEIINKEMIKPLLNL